MASRERRAVAAVLFLTGLILVACGGTGSPSSSGVAGGASGARSHLDFHLNGFSDAEPRRAAERFGQPHAAYRDRAARLAAGPACRGLFQTHRHAGPIV